MTDLTLSVPEVHCDHCIHSIEGAVGELDGVAAVKVDLDTKTVAVSFDDGAVAPGAITGAIEGQGYLVAS